MKFLYQFLIMHLISNVVVVLYSCKNQNMVDSMLKYSPNKTVISI